MNAFLKSVVICMAVLPAATSCLSDNQWRTDSGAVWGTTYHITYRSDADLSDSIIAVTNEINESLSMFSQSSTVARVNSGSSDTVDKHFKEVHSLACQVNIASGGMFDPTVAPLVDLWGFGRKGRDTALPDSADVADALARVGIFKSRVDGDRIVRDNPAIEFDFSAIAKGYGVDCVAAMLRRNGCDDFMVEIGGEVALSGHNPRGSMWRIQVDAPSPGCAPGDSALMIIDNTDCAIATSGNYRNFRVDSGHIYGHTINPVTGYPAQQKVLSATVIAPSCALADALATAIMASDPDSVDRLREAFPSVIFHIATP